jgi:hypothetical protein
VEPQAQRRHDVLYARRKLIQQIRRTQMILDAQQVQDLQNSEPPTDWSKFGSTVSAADFNRGMFTGDDKLHVEFFMLARIDIEASTEANRPIFADVPYIKIYIPGDKDNIVIEPVWDQHKQRFPQQWEQFKRGEEQTVKGTPLKSAPFLTPALVAELNYMKIMTIEQLAALNDTAMGFRGAQEYKQAAKRYLDVTGSNSVLLDRIAALEAQIGTPAALAKSEPEPGAKYEDTKRNINFGKQR